VTRQINAANRFLPCVAVPTTNDADIIATRLGAEMSTASLNAKRLVQRYENIVHRRIRIPDGWIVYDDS
jgi:hypothetical protein